MSAYVLNDCQRKLVEANLPLVPYVVKKYLAHRPLEFDDMISIGCYALCRAAISFSESKGRSFSTYAAKCIIHQVDREVRYMNREKRGSGQVPISLNERVHDHSASFENNCERIDLVADNTVDVEAQAINRAIVSPVLEMVSLFSRVDSGQTNVVGIASECGVSKTTIYNRLHDGLNVARKRLIANGIYGSI